VTEAATSPKWSLPATAHPDLILTFRDWCELNRISPRTGRRIIARGDGPVITQLSKFRIGITVANNARWQRSRARKRRG
jgi:hypothetical protein